MPTIASSPRVSKLIGVACALVWIAAFPPTAFGQPSDIEPEAERLLKAATRFLAEQPRFRVDTESTIEAVLTSGQKIQFDQAAALSLQRPDKLRAEREGDLVAQIFYYDGQSLTLYNPDDGYYATVAAPGTLEDMLDFARETLDIVAPAGDLVYRNAFEILMTDVTEGFVVGRSLVNGVVCDHLAFRSPHTDWQIWIEASSDAPLPRKLVITSRDVLNAPQFTVEMPRWDLVPDFALGTFEFSPPSGAHKIDFLPLERAAAASPSTLRSEP